MNHFLSLIETLGFRRGPVSVGIRLCELTIVDQQEPAAARSAVMAHPVPPSNEIRPPAKNAAAPVRSGGGGYSWSPAPVLRPAAPHSRAAHGRRSPHPWSRPTASQPAYWLVRPRRPLQTRIKIQFYSGADGELLRSAHAPAPARPSGYWKCRFLGRPDGDGRPAGRRTLYKNNASIERARSRRSRLREPEPAGRRQSSPWRRWQTL